jgi:flavodoxin
MKSRKKAIITGGIIISITLAVFLAVFASSDIITDANSQASKTLSNPEIDNNNKGSKVLLVLVSSQNNSTLKIAKVFAKVLNAQIKSPEQINPEELQDRTLIGFGSGIFDQMHHKTLLDLVDKLTGLDGKKVFIFSTSGVSREFAIKNSIDDPHTALREKLKSKGCIIAGEFNCAGFNSNSFLKLIGGMNRGKPDAEDLKKAEEFAGGLK